MPPEPNTPPEGAPPTPPPEGSPPPAPPPEGDPSPAFAYMPENWRDEFAIGGDEFADGDEGFAKRKQMLERFKSPTDLMKSFFHSQQKISEGNANAAPVLPEDATPEQITEYKTALELPVSVEDYSKGLDEGLVLGELDQPIFDGVAGVALKHNIPQAALNEITEVYLNAAKSHEEAQAVKDTNDAATTVEALKAAYGSDYQTNMNAIKAFTGGMPEELRTKFEDARLADGTALFNSPEFVNYIADVSRKLNPNVTVVPNSANPAADIKKELGGLRERMKQGGDQWYGDAAAQKRYQDLLTAQSNLK